MAYTSDDDDDDYDDDDDHEFRCTNIVKSSGRMCKKRQSVGFQGQLPVIGLRKKERGARK
jgi:hypothetical protein